jgi:hypothetical protein
MRKLIVLGMLLALACAVVVVVPWPVSPPSRGAWEPLTDPVCDAVIARRHADVVLDASSPPPPQRPPVVAYSDLPLHAGEFVRFSGYLTLAFEGTAIHPSFERHLLDFAEFVGDLQRPLEKKPHQQTTEASPWGLGLWTTLQPVFFDDKAWLQRGPLLGDRCARVEGRFSIREHGHMDLYRGAFVDVRRLEIWLQPHRPLVPQHQPYMKIAPPPPRIRRQLPWGT